MARRSAGSQCIFCQREQVSDECVFGRWISRLLADGTPFTLTKTPGRSASGLRTINVKNRGTCRECNGGWISRSQSEASKRLAPITRGESIQWDATQRTPVARWAFKTALLLDRSWLASQVAPMHHFSFIYERQSPPESVTIYLARCFPRSASSEH